MVVNGCGATRAARAAPSAASVAALKKDDFPAEGLPTKPTVKFHRPPAATHGAGAPRARSECSVADAAAVAAVRRVRLLAFPPTRGGGFGDVGDVVESV